MHNFFQNAEEIFRIEGVIVKTIFNQAKWNRVL